MKDGMPPRLREDEELFDLLRLLHSLVAMLMLV
jgi:hypothetical protein